MAKDRGTGVIPRHESPIIKAIASVHEEVTFPEGDIWISPSRSSIDALAKAAYSSDIEALKGNIRLCCQYKVVHGDTVIHMVVDEGEQLKHDLVERTLLLLPHIYPTQNDYPKPGDLPALRKNDMLAIVHPLQVGSGMAAIEAPLMEDDRLSLAPVVLALLHDAIEDVEDSSPAMGNVKFRVMGKGKEIRIVGRNRMLKYLTDLYSQYDVSVANRIKNDLLLLTRDEIPKDKTKEEYYIHDYLRKLYKDVFCAKVKAEDFHSNSMAIRDVQNEADMLRLAQSLVPKGLPQVLAWKKSAWLEYHRLLARLEDLLLLVRDDAYRGIVPEIMAPSARDINNFARGYVITGSRKFSYSLMATLPPSGSPVLTYYQTERGGEAIGEMEIPFCRNRRQAEDVIQSGFHGVMAEDIMAASNLIQKRLGSSQIYSFKVKKEWGLESRLNDCKRKYDRMLHDGELGPALLGFNRRLRAKEAAEKWGPAIEAGSKRLERFKLYKVQVH